MEAKLTDLKYYGEIGIFSAYYSDLLKMYVYVDHETNIIMGCMQEDDGSDDEYDE